MNKIIILLFLLVILCFIYINFNKLSESFESSKTKFEITTVKRASETIRNIDTYHKFNKLDKKLRDISKRSNIHQHYISNLSEWTEYEKVLLNWMKQKLISSLPDNYQFLFEDVYIAKFNDDIEMGFPHTIDDTIFLTGKFVKRCISYYNKNNTKDFISQIGSILIHEAVHIWQRRDKEFFNKLYNKWHFTKYKKIYNFERLMKKNRYNPDGVEIMWGWKHPKADNEIIPLAVYVNSASDISHVNLIGVRLERLGNIPVIPPILDFDNLKDIKLFTKFFGNLGGNNYHPNELSAEIISRIVTKEILKDESNLDNSSKAAEIYKKLFN